MSELWTRWQGHAINAVFSLGRCIGCSDHSGVFLTESAALGTVAIKLVPTTRALAESQLPRWKRAGALAHPHLLRMWEWGGCQLDGLPHLYVVMEYADQTLAQLLVQRALTETEAREMLPPVLDALAFLHGRGLVQGRLKPANILVVADQLKLASDTICRFGEGVIGTGTPTPTPTIYDPLESRRVSSSAAGDIRALGVSLFEALTRRPPSALGEREQRLVLPPDFCPTFRDIVAACLSGHPQDRPSLADLMAFAREQSTGSEAPRATAEPATTKSRGPYIAVLGVLVILGLGWTAGHLFRASRTHAQPALAVPAAADSPLRTPGANAFEAATLRARVAAVHSTGSAGRGATLASTVELHEVIPDVPRSARRTIRGHIEVWVRVIVEQDGSVQKAVTDLPGPSRYFRRLAIEAAEKWTFPPAEGPARRLMQVRFDFSRDGTTGRAVTLD